MESARATAIAITGISAADPAVVSHGGSDPSDGDFVILQNVGGLNEVNNRVFRVDNQAAGTFELEGFDSSALDAYTSGGTFAVLTMGNSFSTFLSFSGSGGEASEIDVTTVHDTIDQSVPGNKSAVSYSIASVWDPSDAGFLALEVADDDQVDRAFEIRFQDSSRFLFSGRVSFLGTPTGSAGERVESPAGISVRGRGTNYNT